MNMENIATTSSQSGIGLTSALYKNKERYVL